MAPVDDSRRLLTPPKNRYLAPPAFLKEGTQNANLRPSPWHWTPCLRLKQNIIQYFQ